MFKLLQMFGRGKQTTEKEAVAVSENAQEDAPEVIAPHAFLPGGDNETCAVDGCARFADDHVHSAASIAAHNAATTEG